jgi:acetolactate synthase-1/2/3 large subunit
VFVECPIDTLYGEEMVREWYGVKNKETSPRNIQDRILRGYLNFHVNRLFSGKDAVRSDTSIAPICYPHHGRNK